MRTLLRAIALCGLAGCVACVGPSLRTSTPPHAREPASGAPAAEPEARAIAARGLTLLDQGDYVRAEQYLQLALRAGHSEPALILPLLRSCIASNRLRAALSHAGRYLTRHPDAWHVRYVKAALHRALGQPQLAMEELLRVAQDEPSAVDAEDRAWLAENPRGAP